MILFIEKTWWMWWMLANVVLLRWFHVLSLRGEMESPGAANAEEEQTEYIVAWQLLRNAQPVSLVGGGAKRAA